MSDNFRDQPTRVPRYYDVPLTSNMHITVSLSDELTALLRQLVAKLPGSNSASLDTLTAAVSRETQEIETMSGNLDSELGSLKDEVTRLESVDASATALVTGFSARLDAAVAAAVAAGASPAQLAALHALNQQIGGDIDGLAATVTANTPADPNPPADTITGGGSTVGGGVDTTTGGASTTVVGGI